MSDIETRTKRAMKYKKKKSRDPVAQAMNENHGAFAMKVFNGKKRKYVRERIDVRRLPEETFGDLEEIEDFGDED